MNVQRTPTTAPRMLSVPTHLARSTARATVVTMEMDVPVQVRCVAGPSCSSFYDNRLHTFVWFLRLSATNFLCWATLSIPVFSWQTLTNVPRWFTTAPSMLSVTTQLVRSRVLVTAVTMETESIAQVIPFFIRH